MTDNIQSLGEFSLIESIKSGFKVPEGAIGIGDDCAVLPQKTGLQTLVSTDLLVEGVHFIREDIGPYRLGWKSAAVNISDVAGMGGRPIATFLAFALPSDTPTSWVEEFVRGYRKLSERFCCPLLGGDTTLSKSGISICVTVLGECAEGRAKLRSSAKPGDLVCVTGPLGDSAAGLKLSLYGRNAEVIYADNKKVDALSCDVPASTTESLLQRHFQPVPRVHSGLILGKCDGVHAMMDISDGVGSDIRHILKASGVGAEIDVEALPLSDELKATCSAKGWDAVELALCGGEDYELLFTIDPESLAELEVKSYPIGRITTNPELKFKGSDRDYRGFTHF